MSDLLVNGRPISSLRVVDLKDELEKRGLSKNGRKDELMLRLQSFLEVNPENDDNNQSDEDTTDVIEASRLEAERRRQEEELREANRREIEELSRLKQLEENQQRLQHEQEENRRLETVRAEQERQRIVEEQRREEERRKLQEQTRIAEERKKEEFRIAEAYRQEEESRKLKQREEEQQRLRLEEEQKRILEASRAEQERQRLLEEQRKEEQRSKIEEEKRVSEMKRLEVENMRKDEQKRIKEELRKREEEQRINEEKERQEEMKFLEKEKARKAEKRRLEEEQIKAEKNKLEEEERQKEAEEKIKKDGEVNKDSKREEESRLKEKLLQRLMEDKKNKEEEEKKKMEEEKQSEEENVEKKNDIEMTSSGRVIGGEEGGGDDTLVMEIDQFDLVSEDTNKDKKEKPLTPVKAGEVKPLRRLGSKTTTDSTEKRKRGWGASRTSRINSSENIDISSNLLKDIVPDPSNLMNNPVAIEEADNEDEEKVTNGHQNGNDSGTEFGPTPAKIEKKEKVERKKIILDDESGEETDTILIINLVRPFTPNQLKEMLKRTGTLVDFWLNKIKSKCCARFASVEEASETRMALNGVTWPVDNKNPLHVVFTSVENMTRLKQSVEESSERIVMSNGAKSSGFSVRDWDKDRLGARLGSRRSASREPDTKKPPVQTKSLEELFNKTKASPALYWKPLSDEVIAKKEEARNKRVLQNQKPSKRSRSRS